MIEDLLVGGMVLLYLLPFVLIGFVVWPRVKQHRAWAASTEGREYDAHLAGGLLAKARIEAIRPMPEHPPLVRWERVRRGRGVQWTKEVRRMVRLRVRLLPIGGGEVIAEREQSVPEAELALLAPGTILSVLYDPRDPHRFYLDTARRDESLIDAATMRTRAAVENHEAAARFGPRSRSTLGSRRRG